MCQEPNSRRLLAPVDTQEEFRPFFARTRPALLERALESFASALALALALEQAIGQELE